MTTSLFLYSQKDTASIDQNLVARGSSRENPNINVTIYPVPVRENNFTLRTEKDIAFVKITNIIGQDIFKSRYSNQQSIRIFLDNPKRGMYIVTILFADGTRVVKKIMVEESD
ncbi:MAG: hypothetical protein A2X05_17420 [Bacteroidetes bacterium GWE2_41_25]|nr:MAG: hypothetical protein A2X03_00855 [Bacteroidetes bacterium GWA2_40_15]OFX85170.1 MAG: hypothetical protein A2X06_12270 [Bacteroidetes bacterium GWC2_40_22]OFX96716.1 MAG: hypothetical protein A2X05_17420 [Bacteroidetes bacterium GWE2_41_25]OFY60870.1 MAG: hypothetical protein A2X04_01950 [Bacteroidetes bacterium GWF2_41_9]